MVLLVMRAYLRLLLFEPLFRRRNFAAFCDGVNHSRLGKASPSLERICRAVNIACVCYAKQVFCLQRSAATASFLRACGVPAEIVIGVRQMPFKAHAWVEVAGRVINDKPDMREIYDVLTGHPGELAS